MDALPFFERCINDPDDEVAAIAAAGLAWLEWEPRKAQLIEMVGSDMHYLSRTTIAFALKGWDDPEVKAAVRAARRSEWRPSVRFAFTKA